MSLRGGWSSRRRNLLINLTALRERFLSRLFLFKSLHYNRLDTDLTDSTDRHRFLNDLSVKIRVIRAFRVQKFF